jgi:hypothetical protein
MNVNESVSKDNSQQKLRIVVFFLLLSTLLCSPAVLHAEDNPEPGKELTPITPSLNDESALSFISEIFVEGFTFEGNTVFSDEELNSVASPYLNREITFEELQQLRQELTLYYVERGYVNSGVVIPLATESNWHQGPRSMYMISRSPFFYCSRIRGSGELIQNSDRVLFREKAS